MSLIHSSCLGCVLGAFIGDAVGAYIEFSVPVTAEEVKEALRMPGGGTHLGLGRGQVTDDSEMAICLAQALIAGQGVLDLDELTQMYLKWVSSMPFGLGATCARALMPLRRVPQPNAAICIEGAKENNQESQSNGTLMRMTPLCVWAHRLPTHQAAKAARLEASMTHSNETIQHAGASYLLAIRHLINHTGDREGAYRAAKNYALQEGNDDIKGWFTHIETEPPLIIEDHRIGWAKLGFTHAFRHLRAGSSYSKTLEEVLLLGGDTDTNAAIAGGLIGAAVGYSALPPYYLDKVLNYKHKENHGIMRPDFLDQSSIIRFVEQLITIAPLISKARIGGEEIDL